MGVTGPWSKAMSSAEHRAQQQQDRKVGQEPQQDREVEQGHRSQSLFSAWGGQCKGGRVAESIQL